MLILLEVMDKEPTLVAIWLTYLGLGIAGFCAARFRRWLVVVPAVLIFSFGATQLSEWLDPFVGPAMRHEAGRYYFAQTGIAVILAVTMCVLGARRRVAAA